MRRICFSIILIILLGNSKLISQVYLDPSKPVDERAEDLLLRMTLNEKFEYIGVTNNLELRKIDRLGIPVIKMSDGPVGVNRYGNSTAYPADILMAASWDTALIRKVGHALGKDARARGVHILLAPGMNIYRIPVNGRNFEYFGEDPFLASEIASAYVTGVQDEEVMATAKHFVANNFERNRSYVNALIDERTLQEIYYPAFRACVEKANVGAFMSAYNKLNGFWCSENNYLLNITLKQKWNFGGFVMSDWKAIHSGIDAARGGVDVEIPGGIYMNSNNLMPYINYGLLDISVIDDKVRRILNELFRFGFFDRDQTLSEIPLNNPETIEVSLDAARGGIVLLKNDSILPLIRGDVRSIAIIGDLADTYVAGSGSSYTTPFSFTSVYEGITCLAGAGITINYNSLTVNKDSACQNPVLYTDELGSTQGLKFSGNGGTTKIHRGFQSMTSGKSEALQLAANSDVAVVCVGFGKELEGEGSDRNFELPETQTDLIEAVAAVNKNTIVVLFAGGAVQTSPWLDQVKGFIHVFYPGQEGGYALAEMLFGNVNPSGKLPFSFDKNWEDNPAYDDYTASGAEYTAQYSEGIFVGYRYYDTASAVQPLYPFGFGLSYTEYKYANLLLEPENESDLKKLNVQFDITNVGKVAGKEVVQLYVRDLESEAERPIKELKAFAKVSLEPDETKTVNLTLGTDAFKYYKEIIGEWDFDPGDFEIMIGASSQDIRLRDTIPIDYDMIMPECIHRYPPDNETNVELQPDYSITFSRPVNCNGSDFFIRKYEDNSIADTIHVSDISGCNTRTITFASITLPEMQTSYYIDIPAGYFTDLQNNPFEGFTNKDDWNFKTGGEIVTGLKERFESVVVSLYPNPTQNSIKIRFAEPAVSCKIELSNLNGAILLSEKIPENNLSYIVDVSHMQSGAYFLRISNDKSSLSEKLIILPH